MEEQLGKYNDAKVIFESKCFFLLDVFLVARILVLILNISRGIKTIRTSK